MTLQIDIKKTIGQRHLDLTATFTEPICAIMGASGAGKTTLFKCLCGLLQADQGSIYMDGKPWQVDKDVTPTQTRRIGYLPQNLALFPNLTVAGNLAFGLAVKGEPRAAIQQKVAQMADYLSIEGLLERPIASLSGGEQQRVAMGRALIIEPSLLLFDEPFNGLDEVTRTACIELVKQIVSDKRIQLLFITHHQSEADQLTQTIYLLERGQLQRQPPA